MKILAVVLSLLLIFICIQNLQDAELEIILWRFRMPAFVPLVLGILIGIPIGRYTTRHF